MTLCFYMSATKERFRLLCSDVVVSTGDTSSLDRSPTRILEYDASNIDLRLARKSFISKDRRTALAFAGEVPTIKDFLEYAEFSIDDLASERPLRRLADRASQYRSGSISVLALAATSEQTNRVCPRREPEVEIPEIGFLASVGSGRERFRRFVHSQIHALQDNEQSTNAVLLYFAILTDKIVHEIYGLSNDDNSWGVFVELLHFDFTEMRWERQPKLAIFIHQFDGNVDVSPRLIDRMFLYDPGDYYGWLHSIRSASEYAHNVTCPIAPLDEDYDASISPPDWKSWMPEQMLVISVSGKHDANEFKLSSTAFRVIHVDDLNGIVRGQGRTGVRMIPNGPNYDDFLGEQIANWTK